MASNEDPKSLEMRVAALEDKLSRLQSAVAPAAPMSCLHPAAYMSCVHPVAYMSCVHPAAFMSCVCAVGAPPAAGSPAVAQPPSPADFGKLGS